MSVTKRTASAPRSASTPDLTWKDTVRLPPRSKGWQTDVQTPRRRYLGGFCCPRVAPRLVQERRVRQVVVEEMDAGAQQEARSSRRPRSWRSEVRSPPGRAR